MKTAVLSAIIYKEENFYVAECPETGTASQGENIEEALVNLKEANELYLEEFHQIIPIEICPKSPLLSEPE